MLTKKGERRVNGAGKVVEAKLTKLPSGRELYLFQPHDGYTRSGKLAAYRRSGYDRSTFAQNERAYAAGLRRKKRLRLIERRRAMQDASREVLTQ